MLARAHRRLERADGGLALGDDPPYRGFTGSSYRAGTPTTGRVRHVTELGVGGTGCEIRGLLPTAQGDLQRSAGNTEGAQA